MHITANEWHKYRTKLAKISEKAAELMQQYVLRYGFNVDQKMIDYAYSLATKYGEAAGELACVMYDNMVEYWNESESRKRPHEEIILEDAELQKIRDIRAAEMAETATYEETAIAIRGTAKTSPSSIPQTVSRLVKQAAADTTLQNAQRDGAEFAWIPAGDTCAFCRILASRGWQRQSKKAKKSHAEHIHANCDCQYAVSFKGGIEYEKIYDPDKYLQEYYDAAEKLGGVYNWKEQMNYMRRQQYAKHKDMINAQKRAAYERRKEIQDNNGKIPEKDAKTPLWTQEYND